MLNYQRVPSGKVLHNHRKTDGKMRKSQKQNIGTWKLTGKLANIIVEKTTMLVLGKLTRSMAIFNSFVEVPEGINPDKQLGFDMILQS